MSSDLTINGIDLDALNYTIHVPYNGTTATGGDSVNADLNIFYDVSTLMDEAGIVLTTNRLEISRG